MKRRRQRSLLRRFVGRWQSRHVSLCMSRWVEYVGERRMCRDVVHRSASRWRSGRVSRAWSRWREYCVSSRAAERVSALEAAAAAETEAARAAAEERVSALEAKAAADVSAAQRALREAQMTRARRVLSRAVHSRVLAAFSTWRSVTEKAARDEAVMSRFVGRWRGIQASRALLRW